MLSKILDIVYPKRCVGCGRIGRYFCNSCVAKIRVVGANEAICPVCEKPAIEGATHPRCQTRYSLDGLTCFFRYDGVVRKAIKAIKYRLVFDLVHEFISLIPSSLFTELTKRRCDESSILVPIPLHSSRYRFRGFNQAELLGRFITNRLGIPLRTDILKRTKKTTPQVEMKDREERLRNMEKIFIVNNTAMKQCGNVAIVLFDDVFTTGATMRSAANVLKRTGARFVWAVTMAR